MSSRPSRYWDSRQFKLKEARNLSVSDAAGIRGPWTVCACHGRPICWHPWSGLIKKGRKP